MVVCICKLCGKQFEASSARRYLYCNGACHLAAENSRNKARREKWNPERRRASNLVSTAIYRGDLIRQPCEVCGKKPTDAHHDDYSKPLDVRWLCRSHHKQFHIRNGAAT